MMATKFAMAMFSAGAVLLAQTAGFAQVHPSSHAAGTCAEHAATSSSGCDCHTARGGGPPVAAPAPAESSWTSANIISVEPYHLTTSDGKHTTTRLSGASVRVRPLPGLTAESLQASLEQQTAQVKAASGTAAAAQSPFAFDGLKTSVRSLGNSFEVVFQVPRSSDAKELLQRLHAFAGK